MSLIVLGGLSKNVLDIINIVNITIGSKHLLIGEMLIIWDSSPRIINITSVSAILAAFFEFLIPTGERLIILGLLTWELWTLAAF